MPMSTQSHSSLRSRLATSVRFWTWTAVAASVAVCLAIDGLHYSQAESMRRSARLLADLREARLDLARGFLHLTLARTPQSPFHEEEGIALIEQSVTALEDVESQIVPVMDVSDKDAERVTAFRSKAAAFRKQLADYTRAEPGARQGLELPLRLSFHEVDRLARHVDESAQVALNALASRLARRFMATLVVSMVLLGALCIGVVVVGRRQQAGDRALQANQARLQESEARYRALFDAAADGILVSDMDGSNLQANPAFARMHGYGSPRELETLTLGDLLAPATAERVPGLLRQVMAEGFVTLEAEHRRKDGTVFPLSITVTPLEVGGQVRILSFHRDITESKRAAQARAELEGLFREVGRLAKVGGWELDAATGEGRWTDEVARIYDLDPGVPPNRELGLSAYPGAARERIRAAVEQAIARGTPYDLELEFVSTRGNRKWVRTIGRPVMEAGRVAKLRGAMQDITERKLAAQALEESEARFRSLIEGAPEAIFMHCDGVFRYVNQAMVRLAGASRADELLGRPILEFISPECRAAASEPLPRQEETDGVFPPTEQDYVRLDGSRVPVESRSVAFRVQGRSGYLVFVRDITARRKADAERASMEAQLRHAQKMESVGRLAGGVAHDFNNLLMGIIGHAELCQDRLGQHPAREHLDAIIEEAHRSAGIVRQLLAFARKQAIMPVRLDLNLHVEGTLRLLQRLISEDITVAWLPRARLPWVKMDPSQIDQILANLAVNARDAIAGCGNLTIETGNTVLDEAYCEAHTGTVPGCYVRLTISDTGCGMDRETLEHLFEPFFTTKPMGKGTGLGLATVYGIVTQNKGSIDVSSEPGKGTTFRVYLPQQDEPAEVLVPRDEARRRGGTETILLVEDDKLVRVTTRAFLEAVGYRVLVADAAGQALRLMAEHHAEVALLITDVVMPGMSGRDLAERLTAEHPGLRCLYMSGYTADAIAQEGILEKGVNFLSKPVTRDQLVKTVRDILDAS